MDFQKKNIKNICNFYASKWHLVVMLLPYLSKQIENGTKFETILKEDIVENVEELISKLNLKREIQEKMLNINWHTSKIENKEEIKEFMNDIIENEKNISIILNGDTKQVENINNSINKFIEENIIKIRKNNIKITIISCFKALEIKENIDYIKSKYDYVLNTLGEHKIEEVYNMYKKVISY